MHVSASIGIGSRYPKSRSRGPELVPAVSVDSEFGLVPQELFVRWLKASFVFAVVFEVVIFVVVVEDAEGGGGSV